MSEQQPYNASPPERRGPGKVRGRVVLIWIIAIVVVLPAFVSLALGARFVLPGLVKWNRDEAAFAEGVVSNIGMIDTRLGVIREATDMLLDPGAGAKTDGGAQLAALRTRLAELPLPTPDERSPAASIELRHTAGSSSFYTQVGHVDVASTDLLVALDRLVQLTPDQEPLIAYYRRLADVELRRITNSSQHALLQGLIGLERISGQSRDVVAQLHALAPVSMSKPGVFREDTRLRQVDEALRAERVALVIEGGLLGQPYQISPGDSEAQVLTIARELRQKGATAEACALFAQYGEHYAKGRPEVVDYAAKAQAFTLQLGALGIPGGAYVWQIIPHDDKAVKLQDGDIVIAIDGKPVRDEKEFEELWTTVYLGKPTQVTVLRLANDKTFTKQILEGESIPFVESLPI